MRDEDLDWCLFALLEQAGDLPVTTLISRSGLAAEQVIPSIERLTNLHMVEHADGVVHLIPIGQMRLENICRYSNDFPVTIENGVVRVKDERR